MQPRVRQVGRARAINNMGDDGLPDDELNEFNERLLARLNATGATYLTHTRLHGRLALRIAVGNVLTTERHLAQVWELVCDQLEAVSEEAISKEARTNPA